jgi:hypothetical protein
MLRKELSNVENHLRRSLLEEVAYLYLGDALFQLAVWLLLLVVETDLWVQSTTGSQAHSLTFHRPVIRNMGSL